MPYRSTSTIIASLARDGKILPRRRRARPRAFLHVDRGEVRGRRLGRPRGIGDTVTTGERWAAVATAVEAGFEAQVAFFERLVGQASCTREPVDVEAAALLVDAEAARIGLVPKTFPDPSGVFADHRIYRTPATGPEDRALALVGHVDTVFPRALGFTGFRREGDVVRGPGVLDMKSGLSAVLFALDAVRVAAPQAWASLRARFVCVTDEEVGSPSSAALYDAIAPRTSAALVFEAGRVEDRIVTRRKGGAVFRIEARGRAAHAGNHHADGVSAIHALALLVARLEAMTDYGRGVTVNVGLFEGGTAKNTVPERAVCEVDGRFERAEDGEAMVRAIEAMVAEPGLPERLRDVRLTLGGGITRLPMEATEASEALRARYEVHAAAAGLGIGEAPLSGGGSDANLMAARGVPSIDGLGPFGEHFHQTREWSSLKSLRRRTVALARFLLEEATVAA